MQKSPVNTAYHIKFYGVQNWDFGTFYSTVVRDDFYAHVDGGQK